jgi:glycosyltransferase involved in cell wall biosynthesis
MRQDVAPQPINPRKGFFMRISLVVPVMNEQDNIAPLYEEINRTLNELPWPNEAVFVDDGSRDETWERLTQIAEADPRIKLVQFRRNYGQTAAMQAGIDHATGEIIVTLDGDLQNDPRDIPMMIAKIEEGYDLVHGWRKNRQDSLVDRKLPSRMANWIISKTTGFPIHDLGCTLKAIRREIAVELELYGEMHRFIPILAHARGAKCIEVETHHRARQFGQTKYGLSRTIRVVLDLLTVKYMLDYFASPMKLFGRFGFACFAVAMLSGLASAVMKLFAGVDLTGNPFSLLMILSTMVGVQFFSLGLLGEVMARIYFAAQPRRNYAVRKTMNLEASSEMHVLRKAS